MRKAAVPTSFPDLLKEVKARIWSPSLAEAALATEFGKKIPNLRQPFPGEKPADAHGILLTYKDGLKATVLKFGYSSTRWHFACKLAGNKQPQVTSYYVDPVTAARPKR